MIRVYIDGDLYEVVPANARFIDSATVRRYRRFDTPDEALFIANAHTLADELRRSGILRESKHQDEHGNVAYTSEIYVLKKMEKKEEELP